MAGIQKASNQRVSPLTKALLTAGGIGGLIYGGNKLFKTLDKRRFIQTLPSSLDLPLQMESL
jgi:hypothetical protein